MKWYVLIIQTTLMLSMPVFGLSYHWTGAATPDVRWNNVTNWQEGIANGLPKITVPGHTTITTVPEPAIVVVLCIVGVLGIQRRR